MECLKLKKSNCKNCYKCIRNCPVKSIQFSDNQANIINEECILCGKCFVVCPQNAKEIRNDLNKVKEMVKSSDNVVASIAPSFIANYNINDIKVLEIALKQLGFSYVEETAIGATIVKNRYDEMVNEEIQDIIISSCCPSVNLLIQKYYPKALPYLADVISPMEAHSKDIKKRMPKSKVVFIGPCIAKKDEGDRYGEVDCVLTFEELTTWLSDENINLKTIEKSRKLNNNLNDEGKAKLFPTTGGILKTMKKENSNYIYLAVDGVDNCINVIKDIISGKIGKAFIEMSACTGSCIGGPAMNKEHALVKDYIKVNQYAGKKDFKISTYKKQELSKKITSLKVTEVEISEKAIKEVLEKLGKTKKSDELNCGSCGYDTCRDKAKAVIMGKADLSMCLPYLKEKAESFSDNIINNTPNSIIVLDDKLKVQQINLAACKLMNIKDPNNILGEEVDRILDPELFKEAYKNKKNIYDKPIYLAEYGRYVKQTIIHDLSFHITICIMRDVTEETKQKEISKLQNQKTIEVADKVVERQMRAVQEIASLLGETTAETKIALTKLKESLTNE